MHAASTISCQSSNQAFLAMLNISERIAQRARAASTGIGPMSGRSGKGCDILHTPEYLADHSRIPVQHLLGLQTLLAGQMIDSFVMLQS